VTAARCRVFLDANVLFSAAWREDAGLLRLCRTEAFPASLDLLAKRIASPGNETLRLVENGLDRLGEAEDPDTAQRLAEEAAEVTQVAGREDARAPAPCASPAPRPQSPLG